MSGKRVVTLYHGASGREVPVEVVTVFGRNDRYYRYTDADQRPDRLHADAVEDLAAHNYVQVSSDDQISRTHGVIDPTQPGVCDLNSTNGTSLNGTLLPRRQGREGPMVTVEDGDQIELGRQTFRVQVRELEAEAVVDEAQQARCGWVGAAADQAARSTRLAVFLHERKGLAARRVTDWPGVIQASYALQEEASANGLVVCALVCAVRGQSLLLGDADMPLDRLLAVLQAIPGRKVLALEVDGDPTSCERLFESTAHEDMILLTSPLEASLAIDDDFENTAGTLQVDQLRQSVSGERPGSHDDVVDGLDALIQADSNILMVSWIAGYEGRVRVTFGTRADPEDHAISHSLRFGSTIFRF